MARTLDTSGPSNVYFGPFRLDTVAGELVQGNCRVRLQEQPLQILTLLVASPGAVVTREEIRKRLWPDDTIVEFDHSINSALKKLRNALGDSANEPRFVETVARRGYRLIVPVSYVEPAALESLQLSDATPLGNQSGCYVETLDDDVAKVNGLPVPGYQDGSWVTVNSNESRTDIRPRERRWRLFLTAFASTVALVGLLFPLVRSTRQTASRYKLTHLASNFMCECGLQWSPDGSAIAYAREVNGAQQLFVRYLNSPVDIQLTHEPHKVRPLGWLPDQAHILFFEPEDPPGSDRYRLLSVATVGGKPEFIMSWTGAQAALSADGKALAIFTKGDHSEFGVQVSDPIGSPLKWYSPDPFKAKSFLNRPGLKFTPDDKAILLTYDDDRIRFHSWLLPYPPGIELPRPSPLTLPQIPANRLSWMPDQRHLVISWAEEEGLPRHLWMWDSKTQERIPLTSGVEEDSAPRVSPDGSKLVFAQFIRQIDLTELSLVDGSASTLISTGRQESMASWSSAAGKLVWVSNRNAPSEVWVRELDGTQRPVVKGADFPPETNKDFMNPAISPDGEQIIYEKPDTSGAPRLWISSLRGGVPVPLTNTHGSSSEWGGSWSPDGQHFAYLESRADQTELMIVKTTGEATPVESVDLGGCYQIPEWSPTGEWITFQNGEGWHLISPDGKSRRFLGKIDTEYLVFSKNGKLLYGIQKGTKTNSQNLWLFSLDPATLKHRYIRQLDAKAAPVSPLGPGIRFSLSPDGKSLVYSTFTGHSDLWLMDGLQSPDWLSRLRD